MFDCGSLLDSAFDNHCAAVKLLCVSVHHTKRGHGKF